MKEFARAALILILFAFSGRAQTALQFFTNQANSLLQSNYGFGITNIPIYSPTDTNVAYTPAIHFLLQSAANLYDASTPATNPPSVFRPLFSSSTNGLGVIGYAAVTNDFYNQVSNGFKMISDPTISTNDNVWGIPWVIGMKGRQPAFGEYALASVILAERKLLFNRGDINNMPDTNHPPRYTNQFFCLSVSNAFGLKAWNYGFTRTNPLSVIFFGQLTWTLTNNYNWGTNFSVSITTNETVSNWPAGNLTPPDNVGNLVPVLSGAPLLPPSIWSESKAQFIPLSNALFWQNLLPQADLAQRGWPVHQWSIATSNLFYYALVDASSNVLDFVNLGPVEALTPLTQLLESANNAGPGMGPPNCWNTNGATDSPTSPMSIGLENQIDWSLGLSYNFQDDLVGVPPNSNFPDDPGQYFGCPYTPANTICTITTLESQNPMVHYVMGDLYTNSPSSTLTLSLPDAVSTVANVLSKADIFYETGNSIREEFYSGDGLVEFFFQGARDLPYLLWASSDLANWIPIQTSTEVPPSFPQPPFSQTLQIVSDPIYTNIPARFYKILPPQ